MKKLLFLLALPLVGCVSPSPEASAPVNIRVICGEKEQPKVTTESLPYYIFPDMTPTPEENSRFWEITPDPTLQWQYNDGTTTLELN